MEPPLGPWTWIVAGLVLAALELLAPGVFFIWLGLAAIVTGIADWVFAPSWQVSSLLFAALAIAAVLAGRLLIRGDRAQEPGDGLNRRGEALVGRVFQLDAPIVSGEGRLRLDDSFWRITGPDLPAGARVRVARIEGATLVVEGT